MAKMTAKQQLFCDEYLIDLNATQAAIRAGYSKKTASVIGDENLRKPYIKEYIHKRMAEKESELIADQDEVLKYLTSVLRGEAQSEIVVIEGTGFGNSEARVMKKTPDEKERLKAAELLGKRYGLYTEETERQIKIEKLKAEIAKLKGEGSDDNKADDGFMEALREEAESVWQE